MHIIFFEETIKAFILTLCQFCPWSLLMTIIIFSAFHILAALLMLHWLEISLSCTHEAHNEFFLVAHLHDWISYPENKSTSYKSIQMFNVHEYNWKSLIYYSWNSPTPVNNGFSTPNKLIYTCQDRNGVVINTCICLCETRTSGNLAAPLVRFHWKFLFKRILF